MKMHKNKYLLWLLAFCLWPLFAFAQDPGSAPAGAPPSLAVDAAVVVGPLLILGLVLKNAWESFPNRLIPLVMLVLGMPLYMVKAGGHWGNADAWVTAFMCVTTAVGLHSGLKNTFSKDGGGAAAASE